MLIADLADSFCPALTQTVALPLSIAWFALTLALLAFVARSPTSAAIFTIVHVGLVILGPSALVYSWSEKRCVAGPVAPTPWCTT
jgi:hypothetical protein